MKKLFFSLLVTCISCSSNTSVNLNKVPVIEDSQVFVPNQEIDTFNSQYQSLTYNEFNSLTKESNNDWVVNTEENIFLIAQKKLNSGAYLLVLHYDGDYYPHIY